MADIKLLPHNEKAYEKLIACLKDNQMAAINHATGTGKSFIMLKYLYENRDKRILYMAPTYEILDQLLEEHSDDLNIDVNEFNCFDTLIYPNVLKQNMDNIASKYDIIVLDEYHRCGSKKCGIKINKLLREIETDYPNTKVIGTTATEIRYLDNERNMNNILFNGVEASRLTLADAILQGILPTPTYICYNYGLLEDVKKIESRIKKYTIYPNELKEYYSNLAKVRNEVEELLSNNSDINKYLKTGGKIIVFSSTINRIQKDSSVVSKLLKHIDESYQIHSGIRREINKETLKRFRNAPSDQTTVLYSIDVLNQGVHVKDVDKIFMMRETTSPIIYFQQLGRLLSYSRRKDEVYVFDFVNNIKRHPAIYNLYQDVVTRARKLMDEYPEDREKYTNIINRFRILDETSKVAEHIDKYNQEYSKNNLLEKRLYSAVSILENLDDPNVNFAEKYQAILDINKYAKYINAELFERISKINIVEKPSIFDLSLDMFKKELKGNRNLQQRFSRNISSSYNEITNYIELNSRIPSIFSKDSEEYGLAVRILNNYDSINTEMSDKLKQYMNSSLSLYEKIIYDEPVDNIDYRELLTQLKIATSRGCINNYKLYSVFAGTIYMEEFSNIIKMSGEEIINVVGVGKGSINNNSMLNEFSYRKEFETVLIQVMEELRNSNEDEYIKELYKDLKQFIISNKRKPLFYNGNDKIPKEVRKKEQALFCKEIIFRKLLINKGYLDTLEELLLRIKLDEYHSLFAPTVNEYIEFIHEHKGAIPSKLNKKDRYECGLAEFYMKNRNNLKEDTIQLINQTQSEYPYRKQEVLNEYIEFVKTHDRRPLITNATDYELELEADFNRWLPFFNDEDKNMLKQALSGINKYKGLQNAYAEMQRNKARR